MPIRWGLVVWLCFLTLTGRVSAETPHEIRIPAGPLVEALESLQTQAQVELVYRAEQLKPYRTKGVAGVYTAEQAVRILLRDTRLEVRTDPSGAMIIVVRDTPQSRKEHGSIRTGDAGAAVGSGDEAMAAESVALEEIIVTAQKRAENILSVPSSVAFVSAESLQSEHATGLQDYAAAVAGLQVDTVGTPGQMSITLRGIAPLGSGSAVGTYIDDAPLGSSSLYSLSNTFQLDLLPYDLKGIEILRGPQGTLYGASTMGGLVKYVLRSPDSENFHAAVGGDVLGIQGAGGLGGGLRGVVNFPLVQGVLALRASGFHVTTPGFVDDPVINERNTNGVRQDGGRLALGWTPSAALELSLEALFQRTSSDGNASVALDPSGTHPLLGDLTNNYAVEQPFQQTTEFVKSTLDWRLPFATATSVSSYSDTRNRQVQDASAIFTTLFPLFTGAPGIAPQLVDIRLHKYTEELRLASAPGQRIQWMVGGFATYEEVSNQQEVQALDVGGTPGPLNPFLTVSLPTRYREEAGFANLTVPLVGGWSLAPGIRVSHNSQDFRLATGGLLSLGEPENGQSSQTVTTYSVSTSYQFTPSAMAYGRVATGYQPGGPNVVLAGVPPTVEAATLTNYEVGFKAQLLDNRVMVDAALFRMNWKKIQTTATTSAGIQYLINGGEARSQGLEASALVRATQQLSVATSFAITDAVFTDPIESLGTRSGQRLPSVPRLSASLAPQYSLAFENGWDAQFGANLRFVGARPSYVFVAPRPPVTLDEKSYFVFDLHANAQHGDWRVGVFARNLLDKRAYLTYGGIPDAITSDIVQVNSSILQPRTIGISLDREF